MIQDFHIWRETSPLSNEDLEQALESASAEIHTQDISEGNSTATESLTISDAKFLGIKNQKNGLAQVPASSNIKPGPTESKPHSTYSAVFTDSKKEEVKGQTSMMTTMIIISTLTTLA